MAFLRRLIGGKGDGGYERAVALLEDGRTEEALPLLRDAYAADPGSPRGSVAGYSFRQALMSEGRRRLQIGDADGAVRLLAEATTLWPEFPDLRFLAGVAAAAAATWDEALEHAGHALRRNPDYCEARLLEARVLQAQGREADAVASLNKLIESGRRVDHDLVRVLACDEGYTVETLPDDLDPHLQRAAVGDATKQRLGQAVAWCQAGRWEEGLAVLAELATRQPRYPDVRAKHAAALYQVGRLDEARREVEAALDVNPRYRTAVSLRGLVLAEQGHLLAAREFLASSVPRVEGTAARHEELFLGYLQATLALLLGDRDGCREMLADWHDLGRQFARAALLLVACDHLEGKHDAALRQLDELGRTWSGDAELAFLRAALLLEARRWSAVEDVIAHWPRGGDAARDDRPLLLQARLDVARGRVPELRAAGDEGGAANEADGALVVHPDAWRQLTAHVHLLTGAPEAALSAARALVAARAGDEETGRLVLAAAARVDGAAPPADLPLRVGPPDSWVEAQTVLSRRRGAAAEAEQLVLTRRRVRPELARWSWLAAGFWLAPVRRWLA